MHINTSSIEGRRRARSRYMALLASVSVLSVAAAAAPTLAGAANDGPVVSTVDGSVRGYADKGVNVFLGIPYAAPPVGKLRWQPPASAKKWKGTLDATHFGNTCPQVTELGAFAGPSSTSEDCLYLNVFTTGGSGNGKKKPVIVWIHGGGNIDGETNDYDASKLATGGPSGVPTVVVTLNYRLGILGFFSHASINGEGHLWGNYGILDQQAALRWVQRNIAAFGGDPDKVALGGQSAGAVDTGANQLSPYANGLFNRAIYQSSPGFFSTLPSANDALMKGSAFATAANCPGSNTAAAACLRDLPVSRVLQLQGTPNADGPYTAGAFVDGSVIPLTPEQAFSSGRFGGSCFVSTVQGAASTLVEADNWETGSKPVLPPQRLRIRLSTDATGFYREGVGSIPQGIVRSPETSLGQQTWPVAEGDREANGGPRSAVFPVSSPFPGHPMRAIGACVDRSVR